MELRPATRAAETRAVDDGGISGASCASSSRSCPARMLTRRRGGRLNPARPVKGSERFEQFGEGAGGGVHVRGQAVAVVQ